MRHGTQWPLPYVVEMADGFNEVARVVQLKACSREAAFGEVFPGCTWSKSKYDYHRKAWDAAGAAVGEQERWRQLGRTSEGRWSLFYKQWSTRHSGQSVKAEEDV